MDDLMTTMTTTMTRTVIRYLKRRLFFIPEFLSFFLQSIIVYNKVLTSDR